ncbi:MAG: hypothetical protein QS99_C0001G0040 [archaeon GW2011_AR4]|nr:MAG: hypothetical protein QS99_C0001G0040 [archaeon GW2011_AR4]
MIVVLLSSPVFGQALTDRAQGDVYTNPTLRTPPPVDAPGGAGYVSPSAITLEQGDKNQIDQRLSALYMKAGDEFVAAGQAGLANDMYKKVTEVDPNSPMAQQKYYDTMGDVAPEASECEYHCQIRLRGKHKWKCIIPEGKNTPIWLQIDSAEVKDHFYTDPYTCTVGSWVRNQGAGAGNQTRRHPLGLMLIILFIIVGMFQRGRMNLGVYGNWLLDIPGRFNASVRRAFNCQTVGEAKVFLTIKPVSIPGMESRAGEISGRRLKFHAQTPQQSMKPHNEPRISSVTCSAEVKVPLHGQYEPLHRFLRADEERVRRAIRGRRTIGGNGGTSLRRVIDHNNRILRAASGASPTLSTDVNALEAAVELGLGPATDANPHISPREISRVVNHAVDLLDLPGNPSSQITPAALQAAVEAEAQNFAREGHVPRRRVIMPDTDIHFGIQGEEGAGIYYRSDVHWEFLNPDGSNEATPGSQQRLSGTRLRNVIENTRHLVYPEAVPLSEESTARAVFVPNFGMEDKEITLSARYAKYTGTANLFIRQHDTIKINSLSVGSTALLVANPAEPIFEIRPSGSERVHVHVEVTNNKTEKSVQALVYFKVESGTTTDGRPYMFNPGWFEHDTATTAVGGGKVGQTEGVYLLSPDSNRLSNVRIPRGLVFPADKDAWNAAFAAIEEEKRKDMGTYSSLSSAQRRDLLSYLNKNNIMVNLSIDYDEFWDKDKNPYHVTLIAYSGNISETHAHLRFTNKGTGSQQPPTTTIRVAPYQPQNNIP